MHGIRATPDFCTKFYYGVRQKHPVMRWGVFVLGKEVI